MSGPKTPSDAEFISDPALWPLWPYLPIKRYPEGYHGPECCLLMATERPWEVLFAACVYNLPKTREEFLKTKKYTYPSVEALLADGWVVD